MSKGTATMRALNIPGHAGRPQPRRLLELISGDFITEKAEEVTKGHCWTSNKAALTGAVEAGSSLLAVQGERAGLGGEEPGRRQDHRESKHGPAQGFFWTKTIAYSFGEKYRRPG